MNSGRDGKWVKDIYICFQTRPDARNYLVIYAVCFGQKTQTGASESNFLN